MVDCFKEMSLLAVVLQNLQSLVSDVEERQECRACYREHATKTNESICTSVSVYFESGQSAE